jgi:hypothetical protein
MVAAWRSFIRAKTARDPGEEERKFRFARKRWQIDGKTFRNHETLITLSKPNQPAGKTPNPGQPDISRYPGDRSRTHFAGRPRARFAFVCG